MSRHHRSLVLVALAACVAALAFSAVLAGAHGPAQIAGHCTPPPNYPGGNGYFTRLRVEHTTCAVGRRVTVAYYRCRIKNGKAGTCHARRVGGPSSRCRIKTGRPGPCHARRVAGFACHEHRVPIPTEIDATVTCHKGRAKVVTSYQQNL